MSEETATTNATLPASRPGAFAALLSNPAERLRAVLALDAAASGVLGLVLLALPASWLALLGLPASLTHGAGLLLVPFAAVVALVAWLRPTPRAAAWAIVVLNGLWVTQSVVIVADGAVDAPALGTAVVLVQAAAVAVFAAAEFVALRQSAPSRG